ncbi:MAG: cytochrome c oxidase subunit II [bacterium JZ-2024 1]
MMMYPAAVTTLQQMVDRNFLFILGVASLLLLLITVLMVYFTIRFSRRRNPTPEDIEGNAFLEWTWTIMPLIIVLAMFFSGWSGFKKLRTAPPDALVVHVNAIQWAWSFEYENGIISDVLKVPVNKPVKLILTSQDVIHSFYVPAFRIKEDALPGKETYLWFEATEPGTYTVFCAEYCGLNHAFMQTKVEVLPQEEFFQWYQQEGGG